jgi:hypothetical protein
MAEALRGPLGAQPVELRQWRYGACSYVDHRVGARELGRGAALFGQTQSLKRRRDRTEQLAIVVGELGEERVGPCRVSAAAHHAGTTPGQEQV